MQRKSNTNEIKALHKKLSIQFSLDGFSFCISDYYTKDICSFVSHIFSVPITTPELLLKQVIEIFNTEKELQQNFKEIAVIHKNNLSTLVPNAYFNESKLKNYLNYNIKTLANDYIVYDNLNSIKAKVVYIPFVNINNYLFQNFGEFEFKHHSTILIEKLTSIQNDEKQLFVNVSSQNIDIVVTENGKLLLYNSFPFNTKEDFIYYILFVIEQLQLNPNEIQVTFIGEINENSEIYKIAYTYIKHINFIQISSNFFNSSNDFLNHSNYILVS